MRSLVAEINPVQDLHGQSSPYPAGGGKNKFPYATIDGQGNILLKQPAPIAAGSYIVSCVRNTNTGYFSLVFYDASDNQVGSTTLYLNNTNAVALTLSADATKVTCYAPQQMSVSNVQIEAGSSATSYQPYSNICPISGHTGLSVEVRGKNLLDQSKCIAKKFVNPVGNLGGSDDWCASDYTPIKGGQTYTVSGYTATGWAACHAFYDNNKDFISAVYAINHSTFTAPNNAVYVRLSIKSETPTVAQLELGSTATTYEAFSGTTTTVTFPDSAGTVYGGTDEVVGGNLTSTHDLSNLRNYNASRINTYDYNGKHGVYFQYGYSIAADRDSGLCNVAVVSTTADNPASHYMWFGVNSSHVFWIGILDALGMTLEEFKTWITQNDVIITRRLATPQTFTHAGQQISTLYGQNNVWHDANGDTTVTYQANLKGYIDKVLGA